MTIAMLGLVFFLTGCDKQTQTEVEKNTSAEVESGDLKNTEKTQTDGQELSMLDKLKSAVVSGKKMKCSYKMTDEKGTTTEMITFMQGEKYRSEFLMEGMQSYSVFDGEAMYSWVKGVSGGSKMTMDCLKSLDTSELEAANGGLAEDSDEKEEKEFIDSLEAAQNLKCEDVANIDFSIPGDVSFTDQCVLIKSQQERANGVNPQI